MTLLIWLSVFCTEWFPCHEMHLTKVFSDLLLILCAYIHSSVICWYSIYQFFDYDCSPVTSQLIMIVPLWHHSWLWLFPCDITVVLFVPLWHQSCTVWSTVTSQLVMINSRRDPGPCDELSICLFTLTHCNSRSICQQSLTHMEVFVSGSPESVCVAAL